MNVFDLIRNFLGFAWDDGNEIKNWSSHHVSKIGREAVLMNEIKVMANKKDVLCQSLIKILLSEKFEETKKKAA